MISALVTVPDHFERIGQANDQVQEQISRLATKAVAEARSSAGKSLVQEAFSAVSLLSNSIGRCLVGDARVLLSVAELR